MPAAHVGDHHPSYYEYRYSPPVSPKSQPHGYKRKAASQEDELETPSLISHSFKKLRLQNARTTLAAEPVPAETLRGASNLAPSSGSQQAAVLNQYQHPLPHPQPQSFPQSHPLPLPQSLPQYPSPGGQVEDDLMPVDETVDRVWVSNLDAEIAEIEAEEERARKGFQLSEAGHAYSKIPEHVLKQRSPAEDPAANMQVILYRDPTSISVPEEEDAVRKTIIEARRRMRQRQAEERKRDMVPAPALPPPPAASPSTHAGQSSLFHDMSSTEDDGMDMDVD